jgi:osmotically-inducible protein OsmY
MDDRNRKSVNTPSEKGHVMRSDHEIKRDVEEELQWNPAIDATDIAVAVKSGVVTLTGFVRSYNEKLEAEAASKGVTGVHAVANDIEVRLPSITERPDPEIARDAVAAIKAQLPSVWENIKVVVKAGWVTLEGEVEWDYQRNIAANAVRRLRGVKGVGNLITLKGKVTTREVKKRIVAALHRNAQIDADHISVDTSGSKVVLRGVVRSWAERDEAQRAAWAAPGVTDVDNRITVSS